jgi:hypothetical protein
MPTKQSLRSDDSYDCAQLAEPKLLCFDRKPTALLIVEPQSLPAVEFLQHPDLFLKILDDVLLMPIHPACHAGDYKSQVVHGVRLLTR